MKVKLNILLIEDDFIEVMKLKRAISSLSLNHNLLEAKNGEEALEVLQNTANLPDIILLDLHMPKMNGIEFLEILKADEQLRQIPAIILTTSSNRKDLLECYRTGIAGYVIKPLKYDDYVEKIGAVLKYWTVNELIQN
ncbi:MAG: response regulator [Bacteroidota bacterium]|uniref:Two-component response regulator n=1 Tax=Christiangramia flava JLT2011 TaxID=1229726 RepID=A0A1L7I7A8_9FLAO|nr:response regulator [Christiangramia flava]APU69489.1 Two-component response regulator [Christiangramia flava JLT2011]MEE2771241.1 response regulator [Bacteroidota bacterium]OSS37909.1 two-component response regulator [Christiangramia flava JLT2011]